MPRKVFSLLLLLIFSVCLTVFATPPESMELQYDLDAQKLKVNIQHVTKDINEHYIRKIRIFRNNDEVVDENWHRQDDLNSIEKEFALDAKQDDLITVKVFCSEWGTLEAITVVNKKEEEENKEDQRGNADIKSDKEKSNKAETTAGGYK